MTINQILKKKNIPTKLRIDLELLLAFVLSTTRELLLAYPERQLTKNQLAKFNNLWRKRTQHYPLAYLIGQKEFFGFDFVVKKNVLIPRPETEYLVERVVAAAKNMRRKKVIIADIGTGSGCIAIALKKQLPFARVIGLDTSVSALTIAKKNSRQLQADVDFYRGDISVLTDKKITPQIIVANLPYLDKNKKQFYYDRCPELKYEPAGALFSSNGGLADYEHLLKKIVTFTKKPQLLFLELGSYQIKAAVKIIKDICGDKYSIKVNNYNGTAVIELNLNK